jgi:hypothetical protein
LSLTDFIGKKQKRRGRGKVKMRKREERGEDRLERTNLELIAYLISLSRNTPNF